MAVQQSVARSAGTNLADLLERVLDKGIVIAGDIKVILGDVELLTVQIRLVVCSVDKAREMGMDWWVNNPALSAAGAERLRQDQQMETLAKIEERLAKMEDALAKPEPGRLEGSRAEEQKAGRADAGRRKSQAGHRKPEAADQ